MNLATGAHAWHFDNQEIDLEGVRRNELPLVVVRG
jgi:hypothetical protein